MGTKLNTAKRARKFIEYAEKSIDDSIILSKVENGIEKPCILYRPEEAVIAAKIAIENIKCVIGELEKDSNKMYFYQDKQNKLQQFLNFTESLI